MRNFLISVLILYFASSFAIKPVSARTVINGHSAVANDSSFPVDHREQILNTFFRKYNSPLADYSAEFIAAADYYSIDWRLVPAITGTESTFGKHIPYQSFNAYGWNNGDYRFNSWKESIWHVSRILKTRYYDRGVDSVPKIAKIYAPPSSSWGQNTQYFINKIDEVSKLHLNI